MSLTVLVTGDRYWSDRGFVRRILLQFPPGTTLVHGAARGLDTIAGAVGAELGFNVKPVPADWARQHRAAGPIRNQRMLDEYAPEVCFAFHDNISLSKGTADMVRRARKAGVPVKLFAHRTRKS